MPRKYKLARVTTVLSFVESAWKEFWWRKVGFEEADKISKESASFGTGVHEIVETTLLKGRDKVDIYSRQQFVCAESILDYIERNEFKPLFETWDKSLEVEVKDENLGLIGHFDMAALVNGVPTIVDFKTSNRCRNSFPVQKAAYAKMAYKQFGIKIEQGLTLRAHYNKNELKYEFEIKRYTNLVKLYWPIMAACLKVYKFFSRTDKLQD